MKLDVKVYEEKMKKSVAGFEHELTTIRAGRANAAVLDKITVDYYGAPTQINAIAEVKASDARTLVISPWDASTLKKIEKAILASDLGLQPVNDGKLIRLAFPQATEERRKELAKKVEKLGEECKVAIRNIRRDANDKIKDMKKNGEMTEDEQKASEKIVQDLTDKFTKLADASVEDIEKIVKPCGLGHTKAKDISAAMKILCSKYGGIVPDDLETLLDRLTESGFYISQRVRDYIESAAEEDQ